MSVLSYTNILHVQRKPYGEGALRRLPRGRWRAHYGGETGRVAPPPASSPNASMRRRFASRRLNLYLEAAHRRIRTRGYATPEKSGSIHSEWRLADFTAPEATGDGAARLGTFAGAQRGRLCNKALLPINQLAAINKPPKRKPQKTLRGLLV